MIVTTRANKTSIISIPPIYKFVNIGLYSRVAPKMETQLALRLEEKALQSARIPRLYFLSFEGYANPMNFFILLDTHQAGKIAVWQEAAKKTITEQGDEWCFSDGHPHFDTSENYFTMSCPIFTEANTAFELTGDITGIDEIETKLGKMIQKLDDSVQRTPVPRAILVTVSSLIVNLKNHDGVPMISTYCVQGWLLSDDPALETEAEKAARLAYMESANSEEEVTNEVE